MSLIAYRWPTMIYGTELGLWHGIILTVPSQQVSHNDTLYYAMLNAASMPDQSMRHETRIDPVRPQPPGLSTNLHALFLALRDRHSSNPIDKVCAIAFPFQKRGNGDFHITFPIYDPSTPVSVAWERLISSIASAKMEPFVCEDHLTTTVQLLCLFPHPSKHHWFPSWTQVLQYPDVSIRDNDPIPVPRDMDYSLRIVSGRIYRDCSLKLKRSPTCKGEASYHCSMGMGSETVELVATVPGVELDTDSRSRCVLVDISPDLTLWNINRSCHISGLRHVHHPIWKRSVIIVCEEVDNLAHVKPVQVTTSSPAIVRYRLRRVTTLYWNCALVKFYKSWLPFKPSLEHIRSVFCREPKHLTSLFPPDTFCDPAVARDLIETVTYGRGVCRYELDECRHRWDERPVYEVYLVWMMCV